MDAIVVKTQNLTKCYGTLSALNQVTISVGRGEIYGLVGNNGAGKTTLLKLLAGQIFPSGGEISLFGAHESKKMEKQRGRMGAMIEQPGFYPQLSVEKNMEYYRLLKGIPGRRIVEDVLKTVGMWEYRQKKGKTLSLGMKQRLGLAIALIGEPELLILDEPINGLDPSGIIEMRNLLLKLNREKNITILISSHILSELEQLAAVYGFLDCGRLLEQVSAASLREKCGSFLEISVSDTERYTALLEKRFSEKDYLVLPDGLIHILKPKRETERYSRLAAENGIAILSLHTRKKSLEEYYMNLKGGSRND